MTDTPVATDTPPSMSTAPPPPFLDRLKVFIGDLARPFAIISTSFAASWATIVVAYRVENGNDAAILMGAVFLGVATLYGAKSWEMAKASKHAAEVDIAKTTGEVKP